MRTVTLSVAYMPLVDAAPLVIAQEMGFAAAEGLSLDLVAAPSWSSVRDMLAFGRVDAAHMLSPVPVAMALGLGGALSALSALLVMSVNGTVIGVGGALEERLRAAGYGFDFADAHAAAEALAAVPGGPIVFGVPFPFSMHVELLRYWSGATALARRGIEIRTVPPPLMADALAAGDVDAFCVGEPWGSVSVEQGAGALLLPGRAIWAQAPEKVLAVRTDWAETEPDLTGRLMRAVWRAGRWLSEPGRSPTASVLLSRTSVLDVPAELIDRALSGHLIVSGRGEQRAVPGFVQFGGSGVSFPWRSQAKWIALRLAQQHGAALDGRLDSIAATFRSDLYRRYLAATSCDMPGASEKVEGAIRTETAVASAQGRLTLQPDTFFDGRIFDLSLPDLPKF